MPACLPARLLFLLCALSLAIVTGLGAPVPTHTANDTPEEAGLKIAQDARGVLERSRRYSKRSPGRRSSCMRSRASC